MSRFINSGIRFFVRRFMPGIATALEEENQFESIEGPEPGIQDSSRYLDVEDNGADTTIVAFAGMAILYAAMPKFEFRKLLQEAGGHCNFVFVRDLYRSSYRLAPDGSGDGIAFYERAVTRALAQLGAIHNIAIGMSGGGEAAIRISGAAPIHHVIVFNPAFPLEAYGSLRNVLHAVLNFRTLACEPGAYIEVLFVTLGSYFLWKRNSRLFGREDLERPLQDYLRRAAPATLVYSEHCRTDARQAFSLKDIPSIALVPVRSRRHNCLADMKKEGQVVSFLRKVMSGLK